MFRPTPPGADRRPLPMSLSAGCARRLSVSLTLAVAACFSHAADADDKASPAAAAPPAAPVQSAPRVDNVILITIDTLRADHLGSYGYPRPTSPNLDRFMARGTRFEWAFSTASYTAPSHISMMTGLYPSFTSVGLDNGRFFKLSGRTTTLAEVCRDAGMRTAAVISNPTLNRRLGLHQGFAVYRDMQFDRQTGAYNPKIAATSTDEALILLDIVHSAPFFMWVHYQDPHGPYLPPAMYPELRDSTVPPERDTQLAPGADTSGYKAIPTYQVVAEERNLSQYSRRYDNEIRYLDTEIQRLFDRIDELKLLGNTLVIITSDHGEAFGEDEFYFAHSHSVDLDQVRVPLAIVGPGVAAGKAVQTPTTNLDIYATALEALRIEDDRHDSRSLLPALREGREPEARPVFVESFSQRGVIADGAFFRNDRRPPDSKIWTVSPTTNGHHHPLGIQCRRLLGAEPVAEAQKEALRAELDAFSMQAEESLRLNFEDLLAKSKDKRTKGEQNGLVFWRDKLGYPFELEDVGPVEPPALSDEEAAHRKALIGLGYLTDDDDE